MGLFQLPTPQLIDNTINFMPAKPEARHRASACYWNGALFSLIPRAKPDDGTRYYLDLQYNKVEALSYASQFGPVGVQGGGLTFGLVMPEQAAPVRYLTGMQSLNLGAAYAFWMQTAEQPGAPCQNQFSYFPVQPPTGSPWNPAAIVKSTVAGLPAVGLTDFATAAVGETVFLLYCAPESAQISYFTLAKQAVSAAAPLMTIPNAASILSLDATAVFLSSGGVSQKLAVVALCTDAAGALFVAASLLDPLEPTRPGQALTVQPVALLGGDSRSAIRAGWGTVPVQQGNAMVKNGLVLMHVTGSQWVSYGNGYLCVVDLDAGQGGAPWTDVTPSPAIYPPMMFYGGSGYMPTMGGFVPMAVPPAGSDWPPQYVLGYVSGAVQHQNLAAGMTGYYWLIQPMPCWTLLQTDTISTSTEYNQAFNDADLEAAVGSWILLGVVTGLPPYPTNASNVALTIGTDHAQTVTTSVESTSSVTVGGSAGGGMLSVNGSITDAAGQKDAGSDGWQLAVSLPFGGSFADIPKVAPTHGWLIIAQPTYQRDTYTLVTWDKQQTSVEMYLLRSVGSGGPLAPVAYPFNMQTPNTPADAQNPVERALACFPTGTDGKPLVTWPRSDAPGAWLNRMPNVDKWSLRTVSVPPLPSCQVDLDHGFNQTFKINAGKSSSTSNSNTIKVGADVNLLGVFKYNVSGSIGVSQSVSNDYQSSFSIAISYGILKSPSHPAPTDCEQVTFTPLFFNGIADNLPWVPTVFAGQRPWLLTWNVTSAIPLAVQPSGAGSTRGRRS